MSTTVELGKATAEIARLRAGIEAISDELRALIEERCGYGLVAAGEVSGLGMADYRLRALLDES